MALGRPELYLSLVQKFVLGQRDCVTRIRGCLEQADRTSAHRLAHTLKGTAGQIGARKLRALAETLEAALRGGTPAADLELMLADAGGELARLIEAIEPSLAAAADASTEESSPVDMIDATQFAEMCAALERRLATDDFCSMQLLEQNAALFKAALGEHYASIVAAVEEFDFATALDRLKQATSAKPLRGD